MRICSVWGFIAWFKQKYISLCVFPCTRSGTYFREKWSLKWWYHVCLSLNSAQINLSSTWNFLPKILFRRNNIHREIDHWNRRWFGAKWHVTVPNSVAPVKHVYANEYTCHRGKVVKWHTNDTFFNSHPYFSETVILNNFYKIHDEKCSFLSFSTTRVKRHIWN